LDRSAITATNPQVMDDLFEPGSMLGLFANVMEDFVVGNHRKKVLSLVLPAF